MLLTVNLGHYDPAAAGAEVAAARAELGSRLLGVEIGNEPEHYVRHGLRSAGWDSLLYRTQVDAYRAAIARAAAGVALAGPDSVSLAGSLGWVQREAVWQHPALLTAHYYPLGHCGSYVPTIDALLSAGVRTAESSLFALADHVQRATGIPLRVDESNNVACGGEPGVSDTFAAALWALDYLGRAMASQVQGVNLHGLPTNPGGYAPLVFASPAARLAGRLSAHPEFYALLLAERLVGDRALSGGLAAPGLDGSARAFLRPDGGLDVLAVNESTAGGKPVELHVPLPARFRGATVWRLTAPGSCGPHRGAAGRARGGRGRLVRRRALGAARAGGCAHAGRRRRARQRRARQPARGGRRRGLMTCRRTTPRRGPQHSSEMPRRPTLL